MKKIILGLIALSSVSAFAQDANDIQRPTGLRINKSDLNQYIEPDSSKVSRGMFTNSKVAGESKKDNSPACKSTASSFAVVLKVEGGFVYSISQSISDEGIGGDQCTPKHSESTITVIKEKDESALEHTFRKLDKNNMPYELYFSNGELKIFASSIFNNVGEYKYSGSGQLLLTLKAPLIDSQFQGSVDMKSHGIYQFTTPNSQTISKTEESEVTQIETGLHYPIETFREKLKNIHYCSIRDDDSSDCKDEHQDMTWLLN
jgi:hypothetical protein